MKKVSGPEREVRKLLRSICDMRNSERLKRIDELMDAQAGTPEGAELDRLVDEQVGYENNTKGGQ